MEENQGTLKNKGENPILRSIVTFLKVIVIALLINILIKGFFIRTYTVDSSSMFPTLNVNDKVLTEVITRYFRQPARGEVIVFVYPDSNLTSGVQQIRRTTVDYLGYVASNLMDLQWPKDDEIEYVKRVIGLPGDTIDISNNKLYVNGDEVDEPYLSPNMFTNTTGSSLEFPFTVPEHQYFVMGDNRENSFDSRYWGTVPEENIIGRSVVVFYPFQNFKSL